MLLVTITCKSAEEGLDEYIDLLLQYGAKIDEQQTKPTTVIVTSNVRAMQTLQSLLDSVESTKRTALIFAAAKGHVNCVRLLLGKGADTQIRGHAGFTAFGGACYKAKGSKRVLNKEMIRLFVEGHHNEVDEYQGRKGTQASPLHFAVQEGDAETVKVLLALWADPNRGREGDLLNAFSIAIYKNHYGILDIMLRETRHAITKASLTQAASLAYNSQDKACFKLLTDYCATQNIRIELVFEPNRESSPLCKACANQDHQGIRALLAKNHPINERRQSDHACPIVIVTLKGDLTALKILLSVRTQTIDLVDCKRAYMATSQMNRIDFKNAIEAYCVMRHGISLAEDIDLRPQASSVLVEASPADIKQVANKMNR